MDNTPLAFGASCRQIVLKTLLSVCRLYAAAPQAGELVVYILVLSNAASTGRSLAVTLHTSAFPLCLTSQAWS